MRKSNPFKIASASRKSLRKKVLRGFLIVIGLLIIDRAIDKLILGEMGAVKYERMEAHHDFLVIEIENYKKDNTRLIGEIHALKTDPDYIETLARDKLGLARKGEIVYYYDTSK